MLTTQEIGVESEPSVPVMHTRTELTPSKNISVRSPYVEELKIQAVSISPYVEELEWNGIEINAYKPNQIEVCNWKLLPRNFGHLILRQLLSE